MQFILKKNPKDFLVFESAILPISDEIDSATFTYLKLRKCGYTTFEAIQCVANFFDIKTSQVTFHGLKDEDAITEQFIAVHKHVSEEQIKNFDIIYYSEVYKFISLSMQGKGYSPLEVGGNIGNVFHIVIRNLSHNLAQAIHFRKEKSFLFLNYYDVQRFGLPNYPKKTHVIGKELLEGNYENALDLLRKSGDIAGEKAKEFTGEAIDFFNDIDLRKQAFFRNSYSSFLWNQKLEKLLESIGYDHTFIETYEDLSFRFSSSQEAQLEVMKRSQYLLMTKYSNINQQIVSRESLRSTVTQSYVHSVNFDKDEYYPGSWRCSVELFLPSGCYATMIIKQIVSYYSRFLS